MKKILFALIIIAASALLTNCCNDSAMNSCSGNSCCGDNCSGMWY